MKSINKNIKFLKITSLVLLVVSIVTLAFNFLFVSGLIENDLRGFYSLNFLIANSNLTFDKIVDYFAYVLFTKDAIIVLIILFVQSFFVYMLYSINKRGRGYIRLFLALILHVLSYSILVLDIVAVDSIGIENIYFTVEIAMFATILILQTILFAMLCVKMYKKLGFKPSELFSHKNLRETAYSTIANTAIALFIICLLSLVLFYAIEQLTYIVLDEIALINYLDSYYRFNIVSSAVEDNAVMNYIVNNFSVDSSFLTFNNGYILIDVEALNTVGRASILEVVTNWIDSFTSVVYFYIVFIILFNTTNYIYKRLKYENRYILLIMVLLFTVKIFVVSDTNVVFDIYNILITFGLMLYVYVECDIRFGVKKQFNRFVGFIKDKTKKGK